MAFHYIRFPIDIALGARGGPRRQTDIVSLVSGAEERNSLWANSRRFFDAGYGVKSLADMREVLEFFEERRGRFHSFLWRDGFDFSTASVGSAITASDQPIGTGDGLTTDFQLIKRYGGSFDPYDRPITKPDITSLVVAIDGTQIPASDFAIDALSGIITFNTAPLLSTAITAGFEFDIAVRFDSDRLDIELSSFDAASIPNIMIVEVLE